MKGDFGETIVSNQIVHWFQTSELEDTSGDTAKGDLLWKLIDNDFRGLVEVKNVQIVRPNEVKKFERDMIINISDKTCNCGIFVSLKTETIPNKGKFKLEFINNCPVIYISNVLDDLNSLRFALDALVSIQGKMKYIDYCKSENEDEDDSLEIAIIDFMQNLYNKLQNMTTNVKNMKQSIDTLSNCVSNEENFIQDIVQNISSLRIDHDILKQIELEHKSSRNELKESILRDMRNFREEHSRMPQMTDLMPKYKQSVFREELAFKKLKKEI